MLKASKKTNSHLVSVIIPAYKAEKFIEESLLQVKSVLDQIRYDYEIICVVNGDVDDTYEIAKKVEKKFPEKIKVVGYKINIGKGHAVRFGMAKARGDIIGFIDAGLDINPNGISMLLEHFEWYKADIIIGSKRHPASKVIYPWQRKVLSWGYQMGVRLLFGLNIRDTQAGIKFFRREVLEKTLPRLLVKAWAFDLEMLVVANYLGYKRIYEAPIELDIEFGGISVVTSSKFLRTILGFIMDTLAVFYRLNILHYYDDKNRKNWITPKYLTLDTK
jgi:glycosyltransferase involved in cell wall biosynthesis